MPSTSLWREYLLWMLFFFLSLSSSFKKKVIAKHLFLRGRVVIWFVKQHWVSHPIEPWHQYTPSLWCRLERPRANHLLWSRDRLQLRQILHRFAIHHRRTQHSEDIAIISWSYTSTQTTTCLITTQILTQVFSLKMNDFSDFSLHEEGEPLVRGHTQCSAQQSPKKPSVLFLLLCPKAFTSLGTRQFKVSLCSLMCFRISAGGTPWDPTNGRQNPPAAAFPFLS